jgi:hypothetical protein
MDSENIGEPMARRRAVGFLMDEPGLSERRSCRIVGLSRSVQQYRPAPRNDAAVVGRLMELAAENRRYGYLRLHALLRREGLVANRKRTYRLYTEQACKCGRRSAASCRGATASPRAGAGAADAALVARLSSAASSPTAAAARAGLQDRHGNRGQRPRRPRRGR